MREEENSVVTDKLCQALLLRVLKLVGVFMGSIPHKFGKLHCRFARKFENLSSRFEHFFSVFLTSWYPS